MKEEDSPVAISPKLDDDARRFEAKKKYAITIRRKERVRKREIDRRRRVSSEMQKVPSLCFLAKRKSNSGNRADAIKQDEITPLCCDRFLQKCIECSTEDTQKSRTEASVLSFFVLLRANRSRGQATSTRRSIGVVALRSSLRSDRNYGGRRDLRLLRSKQNKRRSL